MFYLSDIVIFIMGKTVRFRHWSTKHKRKWQWPIVKIPQIAKCWNIPELFSSHFHPRTPLWRTETKQYNLSASIILKIISQIYFTCLNVIWDFNTQVLYSWSCIKFLQRFKPSLHRWIYFHKDRFVYLSPIGRLTQMRSGNNLWQEWTLFILGLVYFVSST